MSKRRSFVVMIGAGVVVCIGVLVCSGVFLEKEPEYGGKRLSEWVKGYAATPMNDSKRQPTEEAVSAIRHIGANAIPHLLKWIQYDPWRWKSTLYPLFDWRDGREELAVGAIDAFGLLGPDGGRAIPELTRILNDPTRTFSAVRAGMSLKYLGKGALPPLLGVLTNQQAGFLRITVAESILTWGQTRFPQCRS